MKGEYPVIEVIYKDENNNEEENIKDKIQDRKKKSIKIPKNVTQIGTGNSNRKIYIENSVMEKIKEPGKDRNIRYGVLLGSFQYDNTKKNNAYAEENDTRDAGRYIFATDYVEVPTLPENIILFNDDIWMNIYDDIKKNNKEGEIVGWYASIGAGRRIPDSSGEYMRKLHLDNFAGINKMFVCHEDEGEDDIYIYDDGIMQRQPVYYIYWGKGNTINKKDTECENINTEKISSNEEKKIIPDKGDEKMDLKKMPWGSVAVIAMLVGVLAFMGNSGMLDGLTNKAKNALVKTNNTTGTFEESTPIIKNLDNGDLTTKSEENETDKKEVETTTEEITSATEESTEKNTIQDNEETTDVKIEVKGQEYIVKQGETLYDISRKYYNSIYMVKKIIEINKLETPDKIYEGQKLILPEE